MARTRQRADALTEIAALLADALGFKTVAINLHRPAWDDFEVVTVHGSDSARRHLMGSTTTREDWRELLDDAFLDRGAYFHRRELHPARHHWSASHIPDLPVSEDPADWHRDDLLLVAMRDSAGEWLGVLSVDEPIDGRRPTDVDLELLVLAAAQVADSLEQSATALRASRSRQALHELLRVSATLSHRADPSAHAHGVPRHSGRRACVDRRGRLDAGAPISFDDLVGEADRALYTAKRAGRDRAVLAPSGTLEQTA